MTEAHRMVCAVQGKKVLIDLPVDFPDVGEVEVIVQLLSAEEGTKSDTATQEWLRDLWDCAPDFDEGVRDVV
jgi:hypothetical protein